MYDISIGEIIEDISGVKRGGCAWVPGTKTGQTLNALAPAVLRETNYFPWNNLINMITGWGEGFIMPHVNIEDLFEHRADGEAFIRQFIRYKLVGNVLDMSNEEDRRKFFIYLYTCDEKSRFYGTWPPQDNNQNLCAPGANREIILLYRLLNQNSMQRFNYNTHTDSDEVKRKTQITLSHIAQEINIYLHALPDILRPINLYRGVSGDFEKHLDLPVDTYFQLYQLWSSSSSPRVASTLNGNNNELIYLIKHHGTDVQINTLSSLPAEHEWLFPMGGIIRIQAISRSPQVPGGGDPHPVNAEWDRWRTLMVNHDGITQADWNDKHFIICDITTLGRGFGNAVNNILFSGRLIDRIGLVEI